ETGVLDNQSLVLNQRQADLRRGTFGAIADQLLAFFVVDDDVAGAQLLNVVGSPTDRDRTRMVEAMADRRGARGQPVDVDRHNLVAEDRNYAGARPAPALRAVSPAHRLGPGEILDNALHRTSKDLPRG